VSPQEEIRVLNGASRVLELAWYFAVAAGVVFALTAESSATWPWWLRRVAVACMAATSIQIGMVLADQLVRTWQRTE
jgi:hypothetical protein